MPKDKDFQYYLTRHWFLLKSFNSSRHYLPKVNTHPLTSSPGTVSHRIPPPPPPRVFGPLGASYAKRIPPLRVITPPPPHFSDMSGGRILFVHYKLISFAITYVFYYICIYFVFIIISCLNDLKYSRIPRKFITAKNINL